MTADGVILKIPDEYPLIDELHREIRDATMSCAAREGDGKDLDSLLGDR
jgi:hypothetical protein